MPAILFAWLLPIMEAAAVAATCAAATFFAFLVAGRGLASPSGICVAPARTRADRAAGARHGACGRANTGRPPVVYHRGATVTARKEVRTGAVPSTIAFHEFHQQRQRRLRCDFAPPATATARGFGPTSHRRSRNASVVRHRKRAAASASLPAVALPLKARGCTSGQCRNFVDRYEWRPRGCALTRWHAPRFCDQLGRRTLLFIGDSTIDQASAAVANSVSWGGGSCDRQIMYANADTLVRRRFGASNRGRPWTEWVKKAVAQYGLKSLVVVLGASAHIYGDNNFTSVLHDVASSAALRFPGLRLIWMTSIGAGCGSRPLDRPPGAAFWSGYASDAPLFNWRDFASRDRLARRFFAARNVSVLDLQPLHMRVDARVSSPTQSWGASGVDCLHFCDTALRLIPTLLHHLLVIEPLSAAAQEHEEEEALPRRGLCPSLQQ